MNRQAEWKILGLLTRIVVILQKDLVNILFNEDGKPINNKGIVVAKESAIANEYWEEFKEKWQPTKNNPNPSLPIEVKPQAIK